MLYAQQWANVTMTAMTINANNNERMTMINVLMRRPMRNNANVVTMTNINANDMTDQPSQANVTMPTNSVTNNNGRIAY